VAALARLLLACCGLITAAAAAQTVTTLKVHHFLPTGSTTHAKLIMPWCAKIEAESAGRLKCEIFPSMQLGGTAPQLYDQVRDGVADVVWTFGYNAGRFLSMEVFELPFMISDAQSASRAAWQYYEKHGRSDRDVRPLAVHVHDAGYLHTRERPVRTLEDLRHEAARADASDQQAARCARRCAGVDAGYGLADAMSKGVIDGALVPWEVVPAIKVHEVARFHTETDPNMPALYTAVFLFAMNPKTYASLPPDLRAVIDRNSGAELSEHAGRLWDEQKAPARKLALDRGNTIVVVPAAELARWQQAAQSVITDWLADLKRRQIDADALLADARGLLARQAAPATSTPRAPSAP
jgi:TRAP-type C4-dicarboxylate transport system substrate-binding protein